MNSSRTKAAGLFGPRCMHGMSCAVFLVSAALVWCEEKGPDPKETERTVSDLLEPFWKSNTMHGESLFFAERKAGEPATATLLFPPEKVLSVKSAKGDVVFEEGKDYALDKSTGTVKLLPGSRIPCKTLQEMYPPANSTLPKYGHKRGDPNTFLIFGEGSFFHALQVEVTYTHKDGLWKAYTPEFSGANLPNTMKKLRAKEPIMLCLSGDSISQGYNASGYTKAPPFLPPYGELVARNIEKVWGSKVSFHNFAIAGWNSQNGIADVGKVCAEKPDLVIIAYGMNDSGGFTPETFTKNIKTIMEKVLTASPSAEFILVTPMLPNAEWHPPKMENFPLFQKALAGLCGKGVVLADMTSVWTEMLKRKSFHDLTGNGVNHPNDFGHRLYAQVILGLLTEPAKGR